MTCQSNNQRTKDSAYALRIGQETVLALFPDGSGPDDPAYRNLAIAWKVHAHLKAPSEKEYVPAWAMSVVYLGLGEEGETFEWLEQSFDERRKDV